MVNFKTKDDKMLVYFVLPFGQFSGHLSYFIANWVFLNQEKSDNPASKSYLDLPSSSTHVTFRVVFERFHRRRVITSRRIPGNGLEPIL
jgi:hypothetical protein